MYPSFSEGNWLRLYSSSSTEGNSLRLYSPPPPTETGYDYTPPPPTKETGYDYTPPPPRGPELSSLQHQTETEEPYFIYSTGDPFALKVPSGRLPCHFMPWVHPFTNVISGPTLSGKSVFVRRFAHNIKHMMTPIPDRILWCYGEYQTLYGAEDRVDFQQGLPDLGNLDPREKHLIILDDLMDEKYQRVASLFTKKSHHRNISVMYIAQNLFHR